MLGEIDMFIKAGKVFLEQNWLFIILEIGLTLIITSIIYFIMFIIGIGEWLDEFVPKDIFSSILYATIGIIQYIGPLVAAMFISYGIIKLS